MLSCEVKILPQAAQGLAVHEAAPGVHEYFLTGRQRPHEGAARPAETVPQRERQQEKGVPQTKPRRKK